MELTGGDPGEGGEEGTADRVNEDSVEGDDEAEGELAWGCDWERYWFSTAWSSVMNSEFIEKSLNA